MNAEYRFRFSEEHLLTSLLRYRKQVWWRRPFQGLKLFLAVPIGFLLIFFVAKGLVIPAVIFGALLGALFLGWPIDMWVVRRRFRRSPFHNDEIVLSLSEEGSHVVGINSEVRIGWPNFTKARRFKDGLLLFQGPHVFNWLPDAAASDTSVVMKAQELARTHVKDYLNV